jgi:hypothetical protein
MIYFAYDLSKSKELHEIENALMDSVEYVER